MSSVQQPATCNSGFGWMTNSDGQDPCTVAAWLIELCENPSSSIPAGLAPLQSANYLAPNGTSATTCTCSWAFYNTIEACTVCQGKNPDQYSSWTSSCNLLGQSSTSTYWQSTVAFSSHTKLPRWSILNPATWDAGTFNTTQAEQIANQNLPDATDASASQPSVAGSSSSSSSGSGGKKTPVGAIVGGVIAGILVLVVLPLALCFILRRRRDRKRNTKRGHVDLDADGGVLPEPALGGNPLTAHLRSNSLGSYPTSPTPYQSSMQQNIFPGYPLTGMGAGAQGQAQGPSQAYEQSQIQNQNQNRPGYHSHGNSSSSTNTNTNTNAVVGITRSRRTSRDTIPTVAEQLDEKRRIRAERQNTAPPNSFTYGHAGTGTGSRTGSTSRLSGASLDDLNSNGNTVSITHSQPHFFNGSPAASARSNSNAGDARSPTRDQKASRRVSLKNMPWRTGRRRTVMNAGSEDGASDAGLDSASGVFPLGGTVAGAGQTTTASEVIAAVPGARLPNAKDRENPPPGYNT